MKNFGIEIEENGFGYTQTESFETAEEAIAKAKAIFFGNVTVRFGAAFRKTGRVYVQKFPTSVQEYLDYEAMTDKDWEANPNKFPYEDYPYEKIECVFTLGPDDVKPLLDEISAKELD